MEPNILLLGGLILLVLAIMVVKRYYDQAQTNLAAKIAEIQVLYQPGTELLHPMTSLKDEVLISASHADLAKKLEKRVNSLSFPELTPINTTDSGNSIFEKLGQSFNPDAPVFAGIEQIVLSALPPDHLASCIGFAAQSVGIQATAAIVEISPILKQGFIEGWHNLHNISVVKECLSSFFTSLKDNFGPQQMPAFGEHVSVASAITGLLPEGPQNLIGGFNVLTDTLKPAVNMTQHAGQIKQVVFSRAQQVAKATQTQAASTVARGVSAHIPYITIIFSTVREVKLLNDKKTSFDSSLKNVALDAVGAGGGAFAGLKAGALIGTAIGGPPGAAIGGLIGSIVGGFGGRMATNAIKEMAWKEAVADYTNTHTAMLASLHSTATNAYERTRDVIVRVKGQYKTSLKSLSSPNQYAQDSLGYVHTLKAGLKQDLQNSLHQIQILKNSFFFSFSSARHELLTLEDKLNQALHQLTGLSTPQDFSQQLASFPYPINGQYAALLPTVTQTLKERNEVFMPATMAYSYDAAQLYRGAYNQVVQTLNEHALEYESEGKRWKSILDMKEAVVTTEHNKLGK